MKKLPRCLELKRLRRLFKLRCISEMPLSRPLKLFNDDVVQEHMQDMTSSIIALTNHVIGLSENNHLPHLALGLESEFRS